MTPPETKVKIYPKLAFMGGKTTLSRNFLFLSSLQGMNSLPVGYICKDRIHSSGSKIYPLRADPFQKVLVYNKQMDHKSFLPCNNERKSTNKVYQLFFSQFSLFTYFLYVFGKELSVSFNVDKMSVISHFTAGIFGYLRLHRCSI